mmetsp:Transcript_9113/g.27322  ORF Transcript_9113/g.27322 Transcript_9113/m.27322 type:complete len:213 (+) Transcript_9113:897-1535(+)
MQMYRFDEVHRLASRDRRQYVVVIVDVKLGDLIPTRDPQSDRVEILLHHPVHGGERGEGETFRHVRPTLEYFVQRQLLQIHVLVRRRRGGRRSGRIRRGRRSGVLQFPQRPLPPPQIPFLTLEFIDELSHGHGRIMRLDVSIPPPGHPLDPLKDVVVVPHGVDAQIVPPTTGDLLQRPISKKVRVGRVVRPRPLQYDRLGTHKVSLVHLVGG